MKKYFLLFIIWSSCAIGLVYAQTTAPKYSNEFLNIGVGARALGMSNVQVASVNDVTAAYWNPAGLLNMKSKHEVALMHSEYFAGIAKYDYGAFATHLDSQSVIALSIIRFGVDDIPDTRYLYDANGALNYNNIRYFSAADYAFLLSYARQTKLVPGLQFGANFKVIHRTVGQFANAWGFGLDAGAQYIRKKWKFGLMARDVTGTFNAWSHNTALIQDVYAATGNTIPQNSIEVTLPKVILGVARQFKMFKKIGLLTAIDFVNTFDGKRNVLIKSNVVSIDPMAGFELDYNQIIFLRFGAGNIQKIKDFDKGTKTTFQPNFGIGVRISRLYIDYALTDVGNQAEALYSNVFSLKLALNK
ncbi:MAG TPA: PorV/PorQ family protein [Cytophagaceae bacterium]|nr:PorV/PorQ family protein [Cytophagaceae bacterium]